MNETLLLMDDESMGSEPSITIPRVPPVSRTDGSGPLPPRVRMPAPLVPGLPPTRPGPPGWIWSLRLGGSLLLLVLLVGSWLLVLPAFPPATAGSQMALHAEIHVLSSHQESEWSDVGSSDQVRVILAPLAAPAHQMAYYGWLLGDSEQPESPALLLGALQRQSDGTWQVFYSGERTSHHNLLAQFSRFLMTQEDASVPPLSPTPDRSVWLVAGTLLPLPLPAAQASSYVSHLRSLLSADPVLDQAGLPGGLSLWMLRNVAQLHQWMSGTRSRWEEQADAGFVRQQLVRVLAYLDGMALVRQDVPASLPLGVNERFAQVGLLTIDAMMPAHAGLLTQINQQLAGLLQSAGASVSLRAQVSSLMSMLSSLHFWLARLRNDALTLLHLTEQEWHQPQTLSLLNDMIDAATHGYVGQVTPVTGEMEGGALSISTHLSLLATFHVTTMSVLPQQDPPAGATS